jgi:hypothetical protein
MPGLAVPAIRVRSIFVASAPRVGNFGCLLGLLKANPSSKSTNCLNLIGSSTKKRPLQFGIPNISLNLLSRLHSLEGCFDPFESARQSCIAGQMDFTASCDMCLRRPLLQNGHLEGDQLPG